MFCEQIRSRHYFCISSPQQSGGKRQLPSLHALIQVPETGTDVCNGSFVTGCVLPVVDQLPLFRFRVLMPADLRQFSTVVRAQGSSGIPSWPTWKTIRWQCLASTMPSNNFHYWLCDCNVWMWILNPRQNAALFDRMVELLLFLVVITCLPSL